MEQILQFSPHVKNEIQTRNLINSLVISTLFLTSLILFRSPFEFYIFYIPVILLFPFFIKRIVFNRNLFVLFIILGLFGLYGIIKEVNTIGNFLKIYLSVLVLYSFYYYALAYNNFNSLTLFKTYLGFAKIVAFIGIFQLISYYLGFGPGYNFGWVLNKYTLVTSNNQLRLNSIIAEPSQYAFVMAPAIFVSLYTLIYNNTSLQSRKVSFVIFVTAILTYSTHAYIVILLSALILLLRRFNFFKSLILFSFLISGFVFIYNSTPLVKSRVDDSILIIKDIHKINDRFFLSKLNNSSFTLLNNSVVALASFNENPLIGSGLGSHPISFEKYSITKHRYLPFQDSNSMDANSLFLRLLSETGLFGIGLIVFILIKFRYSDSRNVLPWILSHSILVMLIAALLREGHYFLSGVPLFLFMYIYLKIYGIKTP